MSNEYSQSLEEEATRERPTDEEFEKLLSECETNEDDDPQRED